MEEPMLLRDYMQKHPSQVRIRIGAFSNKPCLLFKEGFFTSQTSLVRSVNKPCLETGLLSYRANHLFLADLQNLVS